MRKAIKAKVLTVREVLENKVKVKPGTWKYAFIETTPGDIYLCELYERSYCFVSEDVLDEAVFQEILQEEPDFYHGESHAKYFKGVLSTVLELAEHPDDEDA